MHTCSIHSIIIDCAPIGFMDTVGVKALKQIVLDFDKYGVQVLLAAMTSESSYMYKIIHVYTLYMVI